MHMHARFVLLCVALFLGVSVGPGLRAQGQTAPAQAQAASAERPKFDVASVKPNKPTGSGPQYMMTGMSGGRMVATGAPLQTLIAMAYDLRPDQQKRLISGMPEWAKSELFDVEGKTEGNPPREQMRLMPSAN